MQSDPDDMPGAAGPLARVLHRDLSNPSPAQICRCGDYARLPRACWHWVIWRLIQAQRKFRQSVAEPRVA
jgi:hypothetical protein